MEILLDENIIKDNGFYKLIAAGATWKDGTLYPRGQRKNKQPTLFRLDLKALRIFITCGHVNYRGTWIMGCHQLNLSEVECLNCKTATEAAEYAVEVVKQKISEMNKALIEMNEELNNLN